MGTKGTKEVSSEQLVWFTKYKLGACIIRWTYRLFWHFGDKHLAIIGFYTKYPFHDKLSDQEVAEKLHELMQEKALIE